MKKLLLLLSFICVAAMGVPPMKTDERGNPILNQFSEEGFVDCVLRITELTETSTQYRFRMVASYNGELVGLKVAVVRGIQAGFDSKMELVKDHVYRKGVQFIRSGPESDLLISALSDLYGLGTKHLIMVEDETFTAIALHNGDIDMTRDPVKLKIFGRDGPTDTEADYYESFFNLDLKNRLVYWNEKDQEYRKALIHGLSK